jgi:hypothetical protein
VYGWPVRIERLEERDRDGVPQVVPMRPLRAPELHQPSIQEIR